MTGWRGGDDEVSIQNDGDGVERGTCRRSKRPITIRRPAAAGTWYEITIAMWKTRANGGTPIFLAKTGEVFPKSPEHRI